MQWLSCVRRHEFQRTRNQAVALEVQQRVMGALLDDRRDADDAPKQCSTVLSVMLRNPNLLGDLLVDRPNWAWCADIAQILISQSLLYLVVFRDWFMRKVLV